MTVRVIDGHKQNHDVLEQILARLCDCNVAQQGQAQHLCRQARLRECRPESGLQACERLRAASGVKALPSAAINSGRSRPSPLLPNVSYLINGDASARRFAYSMVASYLGVSR